MKNSLGRYVFGLAAIFFGVMTFAWHDFNGWQQIAPLGNIPHRGLAYLVATIELGGGIAILLPKTARLGAIALGSVYFAFALLWIPRIIAQPLVYDRWGNFFELFSQVCGAMIVYALFRPGEQERAARIAHVAYILFGVCVISFTLEQAFYLSGTASFVPKWIPPSQMFWAVVTTIAFALAVIALLSGRSALLAARLLTVMIVGFQLLVWVPILMADPHTQMGWAGNCQNLSILGAAWIVMDYLARNRTSLVLQPA